MKTAIFSQKTASYELDKVREAVAFLFDSLNFQEMIELDDTVILKPNWIRQSHQNKPEEWECVITHPSVITSVLERVLMALEGTGKVVITDGPQTDSSWGGIMGRMTPELWKSMGNDYGVEVELIDLRDHEWVSKQGVITDRKELTGDPKGSTVVDLADKSEFAGHRPSDMGYFGADYDREETNSVHNAKHNKYKVSKSVIEADLFINLPKLKTHKKTGITCSLKNLVGINTYKNWLPHYTIGTPKQGGDQFPTSKTKNKMSLHPQMQKAEIYLMGKIKSFLHDNPAWGNIFVPFKAIGKKVFGNTDEIVRSGNWYGNDTIWRMVLDLNKILFYANPDGSMRKVSKNNVKRYFTIVDGIIGGEGNGPMAPAPVESGVLIGGSNPVAVDCVCAKDMGFDYRKIPTLYNAFELEHFPLVDFKYEDIEVISNNEKLHGLLVQLNNGETFKPHFGWIGHIKYRSPNNGLR